MLHPFQGGEQEPDLTVHFLRTGYRGCDFLPQQFRIPPPQAMHRRADRGVAHIQPYGQLMGQAPVLIPDRAARGSRRLNPSEVFDAVVRLGVMGAVDRRSIT